MRWEWVWSCPYPDEVWREWMDENIGKVALQTAWEQKVKDCTRCRLHEGRTNIVYGIGNAERPDFLFLGEGPGAKEDIDGEPFVGPAGNLLTTILKHMGYKREDVYICNVVSCRPPGNRDPKPDELDACAPVWTSQVVAVRPRMIIALGKVAGNVLLGTKGQAIVQMRKKIHTWNKLPVQVTYHPAGMLRNEQYKQPAWDDLRKAMKHLEAMKAHEQEAGPLFGGT
jgi:uracil-DNA glycosylase family 4